MFTTQSFVAIITVKIQNKIISKFKQMYLIVLEYFGLTVLYYKVFS